MIKYWPYALIWITGFFISLFLIGLFTKPYKHEYNEVVFFSLFWPIGAIAFVFSAILFLLITFLKITIKRFFQNFHFIIDWGSKLSKKE